MQHGGPAALQHLAAAAALPTGGQEDEEEEGGEEDAEPEDAEQPDILIQNKSLSPHFNLKACLSLTTIVCRTP